MAGSPSLVNAYLALGRLFNETSLLPAERQVVLLTVSFENESEYSMSAHTVTAKIAGVPDEIIERLREGRALPYAKLEALRLFTRKLVSSRGRPTKEDVQAFFSAGYDRKHVLDVLVGIGMKTLSNYTDHIADIRLDDSFESARWRKTS